MADEETAVEQETEEDVVSTPFSEPPERDEPEQQERKATRDPSLEEDVAEEKVAGDEPKAPEKPAAEEQVPGEGEKKPAEEPSPTQKRAESYGFSPEEIKAFGNDAALELAMAVADRRLVAKSTEAPKTEQQPAQEQPKVEQKPVQAQADFKIELPDDIDPDVKKAVEGMHAHYSQKLQFQNQVLEHLLQRESDRDQASREQEFATTLKAKPEYAFVDQQKLWNEGVKILNNVYRQNGIEIPSMAELTERAIRLVYPDKIQEIARKQVAAEVNKRHSQSLGRPRVRSASHALRQSTDERALAKIDQKLREFGQTNE